MLTFVESPLFGKLVYDYLSEEEYADLQWQLALVPDAGDIIRGSAGYASCAGQPKAKGSAVGFG